MKYRDQIRAGALPHELLEVEKHPTQISLKKAYQAASLLLNPKRNDGREEEAAAIFICVTAANEFLQ